MADRIAIVVIGGHRSGTSAMTRLLSLAGATLPKEIMPPWRGNETGFWESKRVADFNDTVLAAYDATWSSPFGLGNTVRRRSALQDFVTGARRITRAEFGDSQLIVLKEPRIALLADLWTTALEAEGFRCKFVIMVRNPIEVAASLRKRDGLSIDHGLMLWGAYQASSELLTRNHDRVFCRYDDILARPASVLDEIEAKLRIELPRRTPQAHAEMDAFIRPDLKHNEAGGLVTVPAHLEPIREMAEFLRACVAGEVPNVDTPKAVQDWFADLDQTVTPLVLTARDQAIAQSREQLLQHVAEVERLTALQEAQRGEIERLTEQFARIDAARIEAETPFAPVGGDISEAREHVQAREDVSHGLEQMLEAATGSVAQLSAAIDAQVGDIATLRSALDTKIDEAQALEAAQAQREATHAEQVARLAQLAEDQSLALADAVAERDWLNDEIARLAHQAAKAEATHDVEAPSSDDARVLVEAESAAAIRAREAAHAEAMATMRDALEATTSERDALKMEVARLTAHGIAAARIHAQTVEASEAASAAAHAKREAALVAQIETAAAAHREAFDRMQAEHAAEIGGASHGNSCPDDARRGSRERTARDMRRA